MKLRMWLAARRLRQDPESGQALVEFGLALLPLLVIVAGVIQFGIALSYWHDLNRIANQSARFATVNQWPGCPAATASCTVTNATCTNPPPNGQSLQAYARCQATANGLRGSLQPVEICYPATTSVPGDPVRVRVKSNFKVLPILGAYTIGLRGETTMRLEKSPTKISGTVSC